MGIVAGDNQSGDTRAVAARTSADEGCRHGQRAKSPPPEAEAATEAARRVLPEAAKRALAEAEERRRMRDAAAKWRKKRKLAAAMALIPSVMADWEKDGIISDF